MNEHFAGQISTALHDELADLAAPPDLATTVWRRHHRRTWATRVGGALTLLVVATVGISQAVVGTPPGTLARHRCAICQ